MDMEDVIVSEKKLQDPGQKSATWQTTNFHSLDNIVETLLSFFHADYCLMFYCFSLNNVLYKGKNAMNELVDLVTQWFTHRDTFHTDVQKIYDSV